MQFREFLQLNDGTKIMFSRLKYSGVYFKCESTAGFEDEIEKHAMAVWPNDVEPFRFCYIKGYTKDEIEELRYHICKVGDMVLSWVEEELEEELNKAKGCLQEGHALLVFDKQHAFGFVKGFLKEEGCIQTLVPKVGMGASFGVISLYDERKEVIATISTMCEEIDVKLNRKGVSYCLKNNGEQQITLFCEKRKIIIGPGESIIL